jgi:glycine/sarcosine N-methyltransferase
MSDYDDLAAHYHLLFQDWEHSVQWQASVLGPLMERECPGRPLRILDFACGIGTQSIGLARRGHEVVGTDRSEAAVERARDEAARWSLPIRFEAADMRDLSGLSPGDFDFALAADNALPHLLTVGDLVLALRQVAGKLRPGGFLLATVRDYDQIAAQRPPMPAPAFFQDGLYRRIYHQVWDWTSDRQYTLHMHITQQTAAGWTSRHFVSAYRALLREELTTALRQAGFGDVRWRMPAETGFYQPLVLARRPET